MLSSGEKYTDANPLHVVLMASAVPATAWKVPNKDLAASRIGSAESIRGTTRDTTNSFQSDHTHTMRDRKKRDTAIDFTPHPFITYFFLGGAGLADPSAFGISSG